MSKSLTAVLKTGLNALGALRGRKRELRHAIGVKVRSRSSLESRK